LVEVHSLTFASSWWSIADLCTGYSFHANQVGMTVDTILSFEVVLPSGEVRTVTATSDAGLFWALKISL